MDAADTPTPPTSSHTTINNNLSFMIQEPGKAPPLLDDTAFHALELIFFVILGIVLGLFGSVANVVNMIVFAKQGLLSGGSTLNLFFLAMADFGVVFTYFLQGIVWAFIVSGAFPEWEEGLTGFAYLWVAWPHAIFATINRMLTAYVAFERCMCVVIPFKVQSLFTPRKSLVYLIVMFVYGILNHVPIYLTNKLGYVQDEVSNGTKLTLILGHNRDFWFTFVSFSTFYFLSIVCLVVVIVSTVVTIAYVNTSKQWRQKASSVGGSKSEKQPDTKTNSTINTTNAENEKKADKSHQDMDKETRLVKIITAISIIFCVCFGPELAILVTYSVDDRIKMGGQFERLWHILYAIKYFPDCINSSANIFVYLSMSTRYRQVLGELCSGTK